MADLANVGKYEIRREIGRGAMGVVYEAYDPSIKRIVALKTIRADQVTGEDSAIVLARFRREAQAAGRLNHPNIVAIYDFGEESGVSYIAMEYVRGRELKACFEANERFRLADAVRIMSQILGALEYSHRQGVVHRDIKPANIFLLDDGSVKVGDFGIAHIESSSLTQVGTVLGTPSYMSPEQIQGLPIDRRSDLFSAGVILYQFLTGERPFAGSASTTMQKVLKEDPLPPSTLNVQLPEAIDAVVRKALAKRADDRFQSARDFADAIDAAARTTTAIVQQAVDATLVAPPGPAGERAAPATRAEPPLAHPPSALPPRSSWPAVAIVAGAVVIAIGAGAWLLLSERGARAVVTANPAGPPPVAAVPQSAPAGPSPVGDRSAPERAAAPPASGSAVGATAQPAAPAGTLLVSAVGLVDPGDARYHDDKSRITTDLRADSRAQLVQKAMGVIVDERSLDRHYDWLRERVLAHSAVFVKTVTREGEPRMGKDGLMSLSTEGVVDVKALQKSLSTMSREERIELIRASGNPRIAVRVALRDADRADAPPRPSPVAENVLKERIRSFGYRTWSEGDAPAAGETADFAIVGEASVKRLSMRLEASGITVTKYALASWTVKCVDMTSGEEIYHNTALPRDAGSWPSEEQALQAIGARIGNEFTRDFFAEHANFSPRRTTLLVSGLPGESWEALLGRELDGLPRVLSAKMAPPSKPRVYELQVAGTVPIAELVGEGIVRPLNAKLGQSCFTLGTYSDEQATIAFDERCADLSVLSRFESNPPASLYRAPPGRQKSVTRNPETLRKLAT